MTHIIIKILVLASLLSLGGMMQVNVSDYEAYIHSEGTAHRYVNDMNFVRISRFFVKVIVVIFILTLFI